jgi:hypothetical protein
MSILRIIQTGLISLGLVLGFGTAAHADSGLGSVTSAVDGLLGSVTSLVHSVLGVVTNLLGSLLGGLLG